MSEHRVIPRLILLATIFALAIGVLAIDSARADAVDGAPSLSLVELKKLRKKAAHRRRRVIFNSDAGNIDPRELSEATREAFLASRKTPIVGTSVDTIFECTDIGFSNYSHNSDVSTVALDWNPVMPEIIKRGTDPLQMTIDFCRDHDIEIFWSFRTNDPHDSWTEEGPLSTFKKQHPECLFGKRDDVILHGHWTGVDYALPEVRQHVFDILQDVCLRYDVDGIELDFFRTLANFKSLAWGKTIKPEEREAMTDLWRRVRKMTEEIGMRRGRPILIAVRVPDSVGYCQAVGLDLSTWLDEDLIDIMVVGGYFWLQPWERSVELGRKYGVPVYTSLDGSRVGAAARAPVLGHQEGKRPRSLLDRRSEAAFRAHAMNAWDAGVDGIYLFNFNYHFPAPHRLWTDLGDPKKLARQDKLYHVSPMGRGLNSFDYYLPKGRGARFCHLPLLSPGYPRELLANQPLKTTLDIGDDLPAAVAEGQVPTVRLNVQVENLPAPRAMSVKLEGHELENVPVTWESHIPQTWQEFAVDPKVVKRGDNLVEITITDDIPVGAPCVCHEVQMRIDYDTGS